MPNLNRQKRQRKTQDTWRKWTRRNRLTTTKTPTMQGSITVEQSDLVTPYTIEKPRWTYKYRTTPKPIYIKTYTSRPRTSRLSRPSTLRTTVQFYTQSIYKPWNPATVSTTFPAIPSSKQTIRTPTTPRTTTTKTPTTATSTKSETTTSTYSTTLSMAKERTLRIQPGTILMMNSEYLKQNYIIPGLATTFHRALLADYFGLSEDEMKDMGMTVVAWGFSYQVKDKATNSRGQNRAPKYFCDFKFRSSTFNAGSVGADINIGIVKLDG